MIKTWTVSLLAGLMVLAVLICPAYSTIPLLEGNQAGSPVITAPDLVDFGNLKKRDKALASLYFFHPGQADGGHWSISVSEPWIIPDQRFGTFSERTPQRLQLSVDSRNMDPGFHSGTIIITVGRDVLRVPVVLYVEKGSGDEPKGTLRDVRIDPASPRPLAPGMNRAFRALGYYDDGTRQDITDSVDWHSDNDGVALFVEPGLLRGRSRGAVRLHVTTRGIQSQSVALFVDELPGPLLNVQSRDTSMDRVEVNSRREINLTIENAGRGTLTWNASATEPWIIIKPDDDSAEQRERMFPSLDQGRRHRLTLTIDTKGLPAGDHRGTVLVRSNGGDRIVPLKITVVSLESITLTPLRLSLPEGEQRRLSATAHWSDGSRTDVSSSRAGHWVNSNQEAVGFTRTGIVTGRIPGTAEVKRVERGVESPTSFVTVTAIDPRARLRIVPFEIDLGMLGPGEAAEDSFSLRTTGPGEVSWKLDVPETWVHGDGEQLSGSLGDAPYELKARVRSLTEQERTYREKRGTCSLELILELGNRRVRYYRDALPGVYRDRLLVRFDDERTRTVFFSYTVSMEESRPVLATKPRGLILGALEEGRTYMPKITVKNEGRSPLVWEAEIQGRRTVVQGLRVAPGLFHSLHYDGMTGDNFYRPPSHVADKLTLTGWWRGQGGYPNRFGRQDTMKYQFEGTGIALTCLKQPEGGSFRAYINDTSLGEFDCSGIREEQSEILLAENLPQGAHELTVVAAREGNLRFQGFRILGIPLKKGSGNWIHLSPARGTTTSAREDHLNLVINTAGLQPGHYAENIIFNSNGGQQAVQVSFQVMERRVARDIPVYVYQKGDDHFLWSDQLELDEAMIPGYRRGTVAFNLFSDATPGTAKFHAWYHPGRSSWYYSTDRSAAEREDRGYQLQGSIGNIALVPLPGTRELYRLYNPDTRRYLYTLELREGDHRRRGYRYDGIAGYVR